MTKFLVSDYDGTLNDGIVNLRLNIEAVKEFRKAGNVFAIATGRPYFSIKNEIDWYSIPYDYLISSNGGAIHNRFNNVLYRELLTNTEISKLLTIIADYNLTATSCIYWCTLNGKATDKIIDENIVELVINMKSINASKKIAEIIKSNLKGLRVFTAFGDIYISRRCSKVKAINIVNERYLRLPDKLIYTIGDGNNDLHMLKKYEGYHPYISDPKIYFKGIKPISSEHVLIKKLLRDDHHE